MPDLLKKIERAFLAERLLSPLGEDALNDIDAAWIEEERRYKEYKAGNRPGAAAKDVFDEADRILK